MLTRLRRFGKDANYRRHVVDELGMLLRYPKSIGFKGFSFLEHRIYSAYDKICKKPKVTCGICHWKGTDFHSIATLGYLRRRAQCPKCGALERHRAMAELLVERLWLVSGIRCLDVGGIPPFRSFFESYGCNYISLSLGDPAMVCMDVQQIGFLPETFDMILDSHVLEYVVDYRRSLCELHRVLRPNGVMVLTEAYHLGMSSTVEYGKPVPTATFMVRAFGDDLITVLEETGFSVALFDYTGRNDSSGDYFFICRKTDLDGGRISCLLND